MTSSDVWASRICSRIAEELELILCSASDWRLAALGVVWVRPESGGRRFKVAVTWHGEREDFAEAVEALAGAQAFLRHELVLALNLKKALSFTFVLATEEMFYEKQPKKS